MIVILKLIDGTFDFALRLMGSLHPLLVLAILSVACAILTLLVFRWTSNQKAIRQAKDRIGAHILEIRLFPDQLSVVARAYRALLGSLLIHLRHSLRPLLVMLAPLFIIFVQMETYFARAPLEASKDFLVRATLAEGYPIDSAVIHLPAGIELTAPPVHIPRDREIDWRLQAVHSGSYEVELTMAGAGFAKLVEVGSGLRRVNPERKRGAFWQAVVSPGELPLPEAGPVESIQVQYPVREIQVWRWGLDWLVAFLVMMLVAAMALKGVLRTEL